MFSSKKKKEPSRLDDPVFREKLKSDLFPILKDIRKIDIKLGDSLEEYADPSGFDEKIELPTCVVAKNNYKNLEEALEKNDVDKKVLKKMKFYEIQNTIQSILDSKISDSLEKMGYQRKATEEYLKSSEVFLEELMFRVKMNSEELDRDGSFDKLDPSSPTYETENEESYDKGHLEKYYRNLLEIYESGVKSAGDMYKIIVAGEEIISKSGAPDDLFKSYMVVKELFSAQPFDQIITREDSAMNSLRKLTTNMKIYLDN